MGIDIHSIQRPDVGTRLLTECDAQRGLRNQIVHMGATCTENQARDGVAIATAVFNQVVNPMLHKLGLTVEEAGQIRLRPFKS